MLVVGGHQDHLKKKFVPPPKRVSKIKYLISLGLVVSKKLFVNSDGQSDNERGSHWLTMVKYKLNHLPLKTEILKKEIIVF